MGSFAFTCCVSGLPIEAGDPVRYLLLQSSPFGEMGDYVTAPHLWFVRTPPLRAKYNDYGSVEDIEEGPIRDVWLEMFAIDLIEKGVGDNTCHDVAARKGMTFEAMLEAAWENRLEVRRPKDRAERSAKVQRKEKIPRMYLRQAMIREDVWQALIGGSVDGYGPNYETVNRDVEQYRRDARAAWVITCEEVQRSERLGLPVSFMLESRLRTNAVGWLVSGNLSIDGVGLDTAWVLMAGKDLSTEERDRFLDSIAELALIQSRLAVARFKWRPAPCLGPQCGEWKDHVGVLRDILAVAEARLAEYEAERAKW